MFSENAITLAPTTRRTVEDLKDAGQDFEWYPTTEEIIQCVAKDMGPTTRMNLMDAGCGDGRVLLRLRELLVKKEDYDCVQLFGIEKAELHRSRMDDDIFLVGSDFHRTNITATSCGTLFCNPPYSEYETWMVRIIREAFASYLYFVVPKRWAESELVKQAVKVRGCSEPAVLGTFSFEKADRAARVEVDVVKVNISGRRRYNNQDPFDSMFDDVFGPIIEASKKKLASERAADPVGERLNEAARDKGELVTGVNYAQRLVTFYEEDLAKTRDMFQKLAHLDASIIAELEIDLSPVQGKLKHRLSNLRTRYWNALFASLDALTKQFTSFTKKQVLGTVHGNAANIDFNLDNITSTVTWLLRNADKFYDKQFLHLYDQLIDQANVVNYVSNQRVFKNNDWRYGRDTPPGEGGGDNSHFGLDYRIVVTRTCGLRKQPSYLSSVAKLSDSAATLISDILAVCRCLGFQNTRADEREWLATDRYNYGVDSWKPGEAVEFRGHIGDKPVVFLKVRAFYNGNLHISFNQKIMMAFNVEYGRLKGWIASRDDAEKELGKGSAQSFETLRPFSSQPLLLNG